MPFAETLWVDILSHTIDRVFKPSSLDVFAEYRPHRHSQPKHIPGCVFAYHEYNLACNSESQPFDSLVALTNMLKVIVTVYQACASIGALGVDK